MPPIHHEASGRREQEPRWQIAVENLINAAETGRRLANVRRIGVFGRSTGTKRRERGPESPRRPIA